MFVAKAIANQTKLRRSETKDATYIALLRSSTRKQTVSINISSLRDSSVQETCSQKQEVRLFLHREPVSTLKCWRAVPF